MSMSDLSRKKIAKMIKCRVDARGLRQQLAFAMSKLAASKVGGRAGRQAGRQASTTLTMDPCPFVAFILSPVWI